MPAKYQPIKILQPELYDLASDPGETTDVASRQPDVVNRLLAVAERARAELGDSLTKREGRGVRPAGQLSEERTPVQVISMTRLLYDVHVGSIGNESRYFAWGPFIWVAGLHIGALFSLLPAFFTWQACWFASSSCG